MIAPPTNLNGYDPTRDAEGFEWRPEIAQRSVDFFRDALKLTSGRAAGKPFELQPWQRDFVATLFGWQRADGTRRYREAMFFVPRKNGKTETGAGLALYTLCCDRENKPEVYSAAKTRDQASRVYEPAAIMVRNSPMLASRLRIVESQKRVVFPQNNGYYCAISADAATSHGKNPHAVLFDELHTQPNRNLYDGLKSGMGARQQPLFISMTTAGYDRHSICYEVWKHACNVRGGVNRDPHFLPLVYQIEEGEDWTSEDVWKRCNPNLGVTVSLEFLREEFERAKSSPAYENTFRNYYLNQWTEQAIRWIKMDEWDKCSSAAMLEDGEAVWCGLDMGSVDDLSAFVMAFHTGDGKIGIVPHFFMPESRIQHQEKTDRVPYRIWRDRGWITVCPGGAIQHDYVRNYILEQTKRYHIQEIAADPWNCRQMLQEMERDYGLVVNEHSQGVASMNGPCKTFLRHIIDGKLAHGGHEILRWMATNVSVVKDAADNWKPAKDKSTGKIDGIVAAIMAVGRCVSAGEASWYYANNTLEVG